jgi:hypothetical protein
MRVPAAIEAVKKWVYQPMVINGQRGEVENQNDVKFVFDPGRAVGR